MFAPMQQEMSRPFSVNEEPPAPTFSGQQTGGGNDVWNAPAPTAPSMMPPSMGGADRANQLSAMVAGFKPPGMGGAMPPQAFSGRMGPTPQGNAYGLNGGNPMQSGLDELAARAQAASGAQGVGQMNDPRMMFQRLNQQASAPLDGQYRYDPMPPQGGGPIGAQNTAGTYPGAPPPPGYQPPPPGPFANWTHPLLASMLGIGGQRPQGSNAFNAGTGQWGTTNWFPGYPGSGPGSGG